VALTQRRPHAPTPITACSPNVEGGEWMMDHVDSRDAGIALLVDPCRVFNCFSFSLGSNDTGLGHVNPEPQR